MRDTSFLVLLAFSIPVSFQTLAFQSPFLLSSTTTIATTRRCARQHQPKRSSALSSIFDDEKKASDGVEFESFNPLKYNASGNSKASFSPNQIISLRKTSMQELTGRMLGSVGDGEAIQQILEEYKDFLLEPLEDLEAVLDPDSVYTPQMDRSQRYKAYRESMDERLASSKSPQAREILQSMKDFVLGHEQSR